MLHRIYSWLFGASEQAVSFVLDTKKRNRKRLLIVLPLTAWVTLLYNLNPIFLKWQIESLLGDLSGFGLPAGLELKQLNLGQGWNLFLVITSIYVGVNLLDNLLDYIKNRILIVLDQQTEGHLEDKFTQYLKKFDGAFLSGENNIRIIRNMQWDIKDIQEKFTSLQQKIIELAFGFFSLGIAIQLIHPYLLGIICINVVISLGLDQLKSQSWRQFELVESRHNNSRNELKWRIIWYFNQLLANGWIGQIYKVYRGRRDQYFSIRAKQQKADETYNLIKNSTNLILGSVATIVGGFLVIAGRINIATFTIFDLYISRIKSILENVGDVTKLIIELRFLLFKIDFLLHIKPKLDYTNIQDYAPNSIQNLTFKDVDFTYPEFYQEEKNYLLEMQQKLGLVNDVGQNPSLWQKIRKVAFSSNLNAWQKNEIKKELKEIEAMFELTNHNQPILKKLNFKLEKGKIYALVGYNGAGKTTITKLIKRTLDPTKGGIFIDQTTLSSIDPIKWKDYIASVEQESFIWGSLSVRDNLVLGIDEHNPFHDLSTQEQDDAIWQAIEKVGLKDKIADLNLIMEENLELSGGQRQLLEIARVYLQKKPIIILDEGTNQLDALKENTILQILQEIKQNSIIIFITHRMTTCSRADQILVLDGGELKQSGSHRELLEDSGENLYKKFWKIQVLGE